MIQPRTKTIDTTRGEFKIRAMKAKEHNAIMLLQTQMMKAEGEVEKFEIARRIQDAIRACIDIPDSEWDELEAWETDSLINAVKDISYEVMQKN